MTSKDFCDKLKSIANDYKTVYAKGFLGSPITADRVNNAAKYIPWYTAAKKAELIALEGKGYYGFDCVCLVKAVIWGWDGSNSTSRGGAVYGSNGLGDLTVEQVLNQCTDVSTDFSNILPGEYLFMPGHAGVYVGDGLAVECTPKWGNKVQITAVHNIGRVTGYNGRSWVKHGKMPQIEYENNEKKEVDIMHVELIKTCKRGDKNGNVRLYQERCCQINNAFEAEILGHSAKNGVLDGSFGPGLVKTTKAIQAAAGLPQTGACDIATLEFLNKDITCYAAEVNALKKALQDIRAIVEGSKV